MPDETTPAAPATPAPATTGFLATKEPEQPKATPKPAPKPKAKRAKRPKKAKKEKEAKPYRIPATTTSLRDGFTAAEFATLNPDLTPAEVTVVLTALVKDGKLTETGEVYKRAPVP